MDKELFINAIKALQRQYELDEHFAKALSSLFPDSCSSDLFYNNTAVDNILVEILQKTFNDDHAHSWIEYFCFELDFGKKNDSLKARDKNGNNIPLTTPEDLYNLLIKEKNDTNTRKN